MASCSFWILISLVGCAWGQTWTWRPREGSDYEYYLASNYRDEVTWHAARAQCRQNGGELVSIADPPENDFIQAMLSWSSEQVWIGLNRIQQDEFSWSDSEALNYTSWEAHYPEPDTYGKLCAYMPRYGGWQNDYCGYERYFVCKRNASDPTPRPLPDTPPVDGHCPAVNGHPYYGIDDRCYRVVLPAGGAEGLTFDEALAACRSGPGLWPDLASFTSFNQTALVTAQLQLQAPPVDVWIGLRDVATSYPFVWHWTDSGPTTFLYWNTDMDPGKCVAASGSRSPLGSWRRDECSLKKGYVCQSYKDPDNVISTSLAPSPSDCPPGYRHYWYACYKLLTSNLTWDEAQQACRQDGAHLASVMAEGENAALMLLASDYRGKVWIGLNDLDGDGEYGWVDGWYVLYARWGHNQPGQDKGCVSIRKDGLWYTNDCQQQFGAICKVTDAPPLTTPVHVEGRCPASAAGLEWVEFGSDCYHFSSTTETWTRALEKCHLAAPGASLASIHHLVENDFIYQNHDSSVFSYNVWIGLYKSRTEQEFEWSDGSVVQYTNWQPGAPAPPASGQDCVFMYGSSSRENNERMWADTDCDRTFNRYVCKVPKRPPVTTPAELPGSCPDDRWEGYGAQCYWFEPDRHRTWADAQQQCADTGASLVTIQVEHEDLFIQSRMQNLTKLPTSRDYWTGLYRKNSASVWRWVSSEQEPGYTNWKTYPSSANDKDCVMAELDTSFWVNTACTDVYGYICQTPKVAFTSSISDAITTTEANQDIRSTVAEAEPTTWAYDEHAQPQDLSAGEVVGIAIGALLGVGILVAVIGTMLVRYRAVSINQGLVKSSYNHMDGSVQTSSTWPPPSQSQA